MDNGWIKIHRQITEWEWWDDHNATRLFLYILLNANHKPKRWRGIDIESGEFVTGLPSLSAKTGLSLRQVRTALNKLKTTGEVTDKITNKYRLIKVNNWNDYQGDDRQDDRQATGKRQASDRQATTTKNDKKEKNERMKEDGEERARAEPKKKAQAPVFSPPTREEVVSYFSEKGYKTDAAERAFEYYHSAGWRDSRGNAVRNWKQKMIAVWFKDENKKHERVRDYDILPKI